MLSTITRRQIVQVTKRMFSTRRYLEQYPYIKKDITFENNLYLVAEYKEEYGRLYTLKQIFLSNIDIILPPIAFFLIPLGFYIVSCFTLSIFFMCKNILKYYGRIVPKNIVKRLFLDNNKCVVIECLNGKVHHCKNFKLLNENKLFEAFTIRNIYFGGELQNFYIPLNIKVYDLDVFTALVYGFNIRPNINEQKFTRLSTQDYTNYYI